MERLTEENVHRALLPATWAELQDDVHDCVNALITAHLGLTSADTATLPIWYVLTKASGITGIPIDRLYSDPVARQHALAVMAADTTAQAKLQAHLAEHQTQGNLAAGPVPPTPGPAEQEVMQGLNKDTGVLTIEAGEVGKAEDVLGEAG